MKENQRIALTRQLLRQGLLRLLARMPLEKIRVNALCEESGINRATFYRHYSTPRDILLEMEREFVHQMLPITSLPHTQEDARQQLEFACRYLYGHSDTAKVLFRSNTDGEFMADLNAFCQHFRRLCIGDSRYAAMDENTLQLIAALVGGGFQCLLRQWILEDIPKSPEEIARILCDLIRLSFSGFAVGK